MQLTEPVTLTQFNDMEFATKKSVVAYFFNKSIRLGLISKFTDGGIAKYRKTIKPYQVHDVNKIKYHFFDLENFPGRRTKLENDEIVAPLDISENDKILLHQKILELKNKNVSRTEICKRLNINKTQLSNIYLFGGENEDAGSGSEGDANGSGTDAGAGAPDQARRSTAKRTKNHSKLQRQSEESGCVEARGEYINTKCDESASSGSSDAELPARTEPAELTRESDHTATVHAERTDPRSDSMGNAGDQRTEVLSREGAGNLQTRIFNEIRQVYGGKRVRDRLIGIMLRNIHTNKKFELWFDNETDMILHVGLFCKKDFEFVERIKDED